MSQRFRGSFHLFSLIALLAGCGDDRTVAFDSSVDTGAEGGMDAGDAGVADADADAGDAAGPDASVPDGSMDAVADSSESDAVADGAPGDASGDASDGATTCGDGVLDLGEACDPGLEPCCNATCDGPAAAGLECRASAGVCDVAEACDGSSRGCPADTFVAAGTMCRAAAGVCDAPEACDGSSAACPADDFVAAGVECRSSAGACDLAEACTGSSSGCPADAFATAATECRAAAGPCDVAESCSGAGAACPVDGFAASSVSCRPSAGPCDLEETCSGSGAACPVDGFVAAATECRATAGVCDLAESCTGASATCPPDGFVAAGTGCRPTAGVCDIGERCTGSNAACPPDAFAPPTTVCRASAFDCDAAESCTGSSVACPADAFAPDLAPCMDCPTTAPTCFGCAMAMCWDEVGTRLVINEVDSDDPGADDEEFIELYDGGAGGTSLDGRVLVLFNGSTDTSYAAIDLDGLSTDASGYFIVGDASVLTATGCTPGTDCMMLSTALQNGADAVALYTGDASDFPTGTPVTGGAGIAVLLDALVYGTNDPDDTGLLMALTPGRPQVNESAGSGSAADSNQRNYDGLGGPFGTEAYVQSPPTPRAPNP